MQEVKADVEAVAPPAHRLVMLHHLAFLGRLLDAYFWRSRRNLRNFTESGERQIERDMRSSPAFDYPWVSHLAPGVSPELLTQVGNSLSARSRTSWEVRLRIDVLQLHSLSLHSGNTYHLQAVRWGVVVGEAQCTFTRALKSIKNGWAWINLFSHSCLDKVSRL